MLPCNTPGEPMVNVAACLLVLTPSPPASTPMMRTLSSSTNSWYSPAAAQPLMKLPAAGASRGNQGGKLYIICTARL